MTAGINTLFQPSPLQEWILQSNTIGNRSLLITLNGDHSAATAQRLSSILRRQPALNITFKTLGNYYYRSYNGYPSRWQPAEIILHGQNIDDFVSSVPVISSTDFPLYKLYVVHSEEPSAEYHLLLVISSLLADDHSLRQIYDRFISGNDHEPGITDDPTIHLLPGQQDNPTRGNQPDRQAYWERLLNQTSYSKINFPIDYLSTKQQRNLQSISFNLPAGKYQSLWDSCRVSHFAPRHYYLGVYLILLYKYSAGTDIIAAVYTSHRNTGNRRQISNLDNILPIRFTIPPKDTFAQFVIRIAELCTISESNALPTKELISLTKNAHLLDFGYNFTNLSDVPGADPGAVQRIGSGNYGEKLTLLVEDDQETTKLTFLYDSSAYNRSTIDFLKNYLLKILADISSDNHLSLEEISILTPNEKQKIQLEYNRPDICVGRPSTIIELFEATRARLPDRMAVIYEDIRLSYQDLAGRVDRLAATLATMGDFHQQIIGVYLPRGIDHLVAMLAIFKIGAIYLPVPDNNPEKRNIQIINDSQPVALITAAPNYKNLRSAIEKHAQITRILYIEDLPANIQTNPVANRCSLPAAAYMVYTSGSTGASKGAINRHDGLVNQLLSKVGSMGLPRGFRMLHTAPLSSDISIWQFLAPLSSEGTTVICNEFSLYIQPLLHELIVKEELTIAEWVPSLLNLYLEYLATLPSITMPALTTVMVTGEDLPKSTVNKCLELIPGVTVANAYGPTETSDDVTVFTINSPLPLNTVKVPIGKPINNVFIVIVDGNMLLCPTGVIGEICVIGVAVGNGYWNDPQKTAQKFIDNPFPEFPGQRLYRTNDYGRWLNDGTIEFHGRIDSQVKINGNRIELGEIESVLSGFPGIREAIVEIKSESRDEKANKKLIAFYTAPGNISHAEFNKFMLDRLPPYMAPSIYVRIDKFPLNSNGKIDRANLINNI
jgi:amino acid adenylation domain-containing protein